MNERAPHLKLNYKKKICLFFFFNKLIKGKLRVVRSKKKRKLRIMIYKKKIFFYNLPQKTNQKRKKKR